MTDFKSLQIAVLTVSDSRTEETDTSGKELVGMLEGAGHALADKRIEKDAVYAIRSTVSHWIADPMVDTVLVTGGTGFTGRDTTPEALMPLFDKVMLRKRALIESVNDQLKNISQIEHSRHRSVVGFMVNLVAGLIAYTYQAKKPSLNLSRVELADLPALL